MPNSSLFMRQQVFRQRAERIEVCLVRRRQQVPQGRDDVLQELRLTDGRKPSVGAKALH